MASLERIAAALMVLAALGGTEAALYKNYQVCYGYIYNDFQGYDTCTYCCWDNGYKEKISEGSGVIPCICQVEKDSPGEGDILVQSAKLYENLEVCAHYMLNPVNNKDYCLDCCKEAHYSEKGRALFPQASPCTCRAKKMHPDANDVLVDGNTSKAQ